MGKEYGSLFRIKVERVNSFTKDGSGGNLAGVVLNADGLSDEQKLKIAQAVGYSETAFVADDNKADYQVSFFTTTGEVDFCGHATLATFFTLFNGGKIAAGTYVQRTKAGLLRVWIESGGKVVMEQQLPQKLNCFTYQEISGVIGVESHVLESTQLPIEIVSTGLADLIIPVPTGYLDKIQPDDKRIADFCRQHQLVGFHVFELSTQDSELTASCRNFAPLYGISEESATGSSNGALACYLAEHVKSGCDYIFEQGRAMNCASMILASVQRKDSKITQVKVGGFATSVDPVFITL